MSNSTRLRSHKVVSALPGTLEPNAIYFVRTGAGFDLYCTDQTGSVAHKINGDTRTLSFILPVGNETVILVNNGGFTVLSVTAIQNITSGSNATGTITFRNNNSAIAGLSSLSFSNVRSNNFNASSGNSISTGNNLDIVITGLSQQIQIAFSLTMRIN